MLIENGHDISQKLYWLSQGPHPYIFQHPGYDINSFHFFTRDQDLNKSYSKHWSVIGCTNNFSRKFKK